MNTYRTEATREDLQAAGIDDMVALQYHASVQEDPALKQAAIDRINRLAEEQGIVAGSNAAFYEAKARGKHAFFTVPAINCRMVTFTTARAAIRAAEALGLPHIVFELAVSEMGYTGQDKAEYAALIKAAYLSLGITHRTIYLQADHYQLDPKKYAADPEAEVARMQDLIVKAIEAGVYNIDLDSSKFETDDPNKTDRENQKENARLTAVLFHFIRQYEKEHALPCTISIGGEVGEVGGENTKYPAVNAYLAMLKEHADAMGSGDAPGLSKVSINVGSAHGGVLGPDGKPLETVPLDFVAHHDLYMHGKDPFSDAPHVVSVQHGASTLPKQSFALFPAMHVGEIHLATGFQNVVWDVLEAHDAALYARMKERLYAEYGDKISAHSTDAVGFMKERKRVTEFFKKELLTSPAVPQIELALEQECTTIFMSLYTMFAQSEGHVETGERED